VQTAVEELREAEFPAEGERLLRGALVFLPAARAGTVEQRLRMGEQRGQQRGRHRAGAHALDDELALAPGERQQPQ
jgi:hypothetical protein